MGQLLHPLPVETFTGVTCFSGAAKAEEPAKPVAPMKFEAIKTGVSPHTLPPMPEATTLLAAAFFSCGKNAGQPLFEYTLTSVAR